MIRGDEQESRQNEFIDIEFESVLFINDYIDKFAEAIKNSVLSELFSTALLFLLLNP